MVAAGLVIAAILAVAAVISLNRAGPPPARKPATIASAMSATSAAVRYLPCWFAFPAGRRAQCGVLTVPETRGAPSSPRLQLRFVVLEAATAQPAAPIIYISGGPGEPAGLDAAGIANWWRWVERETWLRNRDFVLFDPRGVGLSAPTMTCPEFAAAADRVYSGAGNAAALWSEAATQCARRLAASGIDLHSFNTAALAADVESLLPRLGYRDWILLATSYGTRVALRVAAATPDKTRAMILDSVDPPEIREYVEGAAGAAAAFGQLFNDCTEEPACNRAFPDLATTFTALIGRAARAPLTFTLRKSDGTPMRAALDDGKLVEMFARDFYDARQIRTLPAAIAAVAAGDVAPLKPLVRSAMDDYAPGGASLGLYFSVECHDDFPFNPRAAVDQAAAAQPLYQDYALSTLPLAVCPNWPAGAAPAATHAPVASVVPTLMLSGALDPATPRAWAKDAARTLPHAYRIVFPSAGHGVLGAGNCASRLVARFLSDTAKAPYDACMLLLGPPRFRLAMGRGAE